jgi:integrase
MKSTVSFQALLQRFFTDRLMQQRQVSAHTISSYRDTFRLLLRFARKRLHKTPDQLAFEDIDAPLVAAFLNDLEKTRDISARTRNLRLTAIRSFFRYAAFEASAYSAQIQRSFPCTASATTGRSFASSRAQKWMRYWPPRTRALGMVVVTTLCSCSQWKQGCVSRKSAD